MIVFADLVDQDYVWDDKADDQNAQKYATHDKISMIDMLHSGVNIIINFL